MVHTVRRRYKKGRNRCVDKIALSKEGNVGTGGTLPCGEVRPSGEILNPAAAKNLGERRVFLPQREGVCFCHRGKVCVFAADGRRVFLSKIIEGLYDGEKESAPGKALS